MRLLGLTLPLLLISTTFYPPSPDRCDVRREVSGELAAGDIGGIIITARAGDLEVSGSADGTIRVRGVICASSEELADASRLVVERRQDVAWVEADLPHRDGRRGDYLRMDLVLVVPNDLPADIDDGSGNISVAGLAAVRIDDGSGSIEIEDIAGAVHVDDGSGSVTIREAGSVALDDGSGSVVIEGVRDDVRVYEDGSGSMDIRRVGGSVRIDDDGSGSIRVADVAGDLLVVDDGSGSISHRGVQGHIDIPR